MPEFFKTVGAARFGVMAGVAAVLTAFFLYIAGAITEPPKTILFSGLESRDAAAVTGKLDGMAVKYDVKEGGTILAIGPQVRAPREFTIGDAVIFSPDAGEELSFQQHVIIAIREADVLAVVEEQSHGRH